MQFVIVLLALVGCAFGQFNKPFGLPTRQQVFRQPTQFQVQPQYDTQYRSSEYNARIRQQQQDIAPDGSYSYSYDTDNGISVAENGSPKAVPEGQAEVVQGQFSYTAPDGTPINVRYFADENGFRAEGAHLPTPPPIPEAIQRSIIFNQQHPEPAQPTYQQQPAYQQPQYRPQTYNTFGTRRF